MYNILHIEQSGFFSKLLEKIVKEKGHKYINVRDFNEARDVLNSQNVSLIISSLYANGGDIEEFVEAINKRFDIPIFVVTSEDMDDKRKDLVNIGISEYILKKDLEEEVRNYLDSIFRTDEYMRDLQEANIAIVEDNEFFIELEKEILRSRRIYNVDYYKDGKSLIDSGKKYDIYLIDIILKNEFGKDIIRKIRRSNIDSSIIAVTALDNNKALSKILDCGADDFITKPIDEELFIAKLKSNVRIYSLQKKLDKFIKN